MRKKLILSYPTVSVEREEGIIYAGVLSGNNVNYLICDYYSEKAHKYRTAISKDDFINYDYESEKWDKKSRWESDWHSQISVAEYDTASVKIIKKYAKENMDYKWTNRSDIWNLKSIAWDNRQKRKGNREKAERNELFDKLPEVTKGFMMSIDKTVKRKNKIYYERKGKFAEYHCCQCGEDYTLRIKQGDSYEESLRQVTAVPEKYNMSVCPMCQQEGLLYPSGYAKTETDNFKALDYESVNGMLIIRGYEVTSVRNIYSSVKTDIWEDTRIFLERGKARIYRRYGDSWYKINYLNLGNNIDVYDYNAADAIEKSDLRYIPDGLESLYVTRGATAGATDRLYAVISYARCPQMEQLYKLGFYGVCRRILLKDGVTKMVDKKATGAADILRLSKEDYRYITAHMSEQKEVVTPYGIRRNDDATLLDGVIAARKQGIPYDKYDIYIELYKCSRVEGLKLLLKYQSLTKLHNVLKRYEEEYGTLEQAITEYADYIRLRKARGDDLNNTVYLRPRSLRDTFSELRTEEERNRDKTYIKKMTVKYGNIAKVSEKIKKKYTYETEEYLIRPAVNAEEIVTEGRFLHHCVGSDSQRYMKNYNDNKSYILVLRKKNLPNVPYVTIEIDDKRICQWYGVNDSKPDEEVIEVLLMEYTAWLDRKKGKLKEAAEIASQPVLMPAAI